MVDSQLVSTLSPKITRELYAARGARRRVALQVCREVTGARFEMVMLIFCFVWDVEPGMALTTAE